jgi:uncharacterized protein (TIGR02996 family)
MTEQDALLQAVCDAPEEDPPRLVYADWLEEHADPDYASFIRLQIQIARTPSESRKRDPERDELRARENAVRQRLKKRWKPLLGPLRASKRDFARGFHFAVADRFAAFTYPTFAAECAKWWPALPLRRIELVNAVPVELAENEYLSRLTELRIRLGPSSVLMEEELAIRLLQSPRLTGLRHLNLGFFPWTQRVVEALDCFVSAGRLVSLGLRFCTPRYSSGFAWMPTYHTPTQGTNLLEAFQELLGRHSTYLPGRYGTKWPR